MRCRARTKSFTGTEKDGEGVACGVDLPVSPRPSDNTLWTLKAVSFGNGVIRRYILMVVAAWFNEENGGVFGPVARFLTPSNTEFYLPRRVLLFICLGFFMSACSVWIFGDEYVQGKKTNMLNASDFPVHISFHDVGCMIPGIELPVLKGITGEIRAGKMTGILGKSGSGKTTLAMALLGREKLSCNPSLGQVYMNGYKRSLDAFTDRVGFVPQEDVIYPELTVEEVLNFSASWRLPVGTTDEEKRENLEETLKILGLTAVRHQRIGPTRTSSGLSSGEKKRVSIGMELIANPSIVVMDEPTTGLDSSASYRLMRILREISDKRGVSVVCVVHQPTTRVFNLFHDIILLEAGGAAFVGPRTDVLPYFEKLGYTNDNSITTLAEFVLDILVGLEAPSAGSIAAQSTRGQVDLVKLWHEQGRMNETWKGIEAKLEKQREEDYFKLKHIHGDEKQLRVVRDEMEYCVENYPSGGRLVCYLIVGLLRPDSLYETIPKPGVVAQSRLWAQRFIMLAWRRKSAWDVIGIALLAIVVSFTRSYCKTWNRKPVSNFFLSITISLLAMLAAVLNDEIGPTKRAVSSGMLLGAHEFAYVVVSVGKAILASEIFATFYHLFLYLRTGVWCCNPYDFGKEFEFTHLVLLCYLCAHSIGSIICVIVDHDMTKAYICAIVSLVVSHVFALYSPSKDQIQTNSMVFGKFNTAPVVNLLCSLSYARYFMEGMLLWEPVDDDPVGRNFAKRMYGYKEEHKTMCFTCLFAIWMSSVFFRTFLFYVLNANVYNSMYNLPLLFMFVIKVIVAYILALFIMTVVHEGPQLRKFWLQTLEEFREQQRQQAELEQEEAEHEDVDVLN